MERADQAGEVLAAAHQQGDAIKGLTAVVRGVARQLVDLVDPPDPGCWVTSACWLTAWAISSLVWVTRASIRLIWSRAPRRWPPCAAGRALMSGPPAPCHRTVAGALLQRPYHKSLISPVELGFLGQGLYLVVLPPQSCALFTGPCRLDGRIEGGRLV